MKQAIFFDLSVLISFIHRFISIETNRPESHFLAVREMEATTADVICETIKSVIEEKGLDITKLVGIGTDGASVMRGTQSGVVTRYILLTILVN